MRRFLMFTALVAIAAAPVALAEEEISMLEKVPAGEFWYGMADPEGKPMGYARLANSRGDDGGLSVDWELKLAFPGGTYEEMRTLTLDAAGEITGSSYHAMGNLVCLGERTAEGWFVTTIVDGKPSRRAEEPPPAAAITGMGFVLASAVPREEGGEIRRPEVDEANGFASEGEAVFTWRGTEEQEWEGETVTSHLVVFRKANGNELPIHLLPDGRILRADWGGGNVMTLSPESTKHLFRPEDPAIEVVSAGAELVMRGELEKFSPEEIFDHFTDPEKLSRFWAPKAEIEGKAGGKYHLEWPGPGWRLLGVIRDFERGKRFSFTWKWAHMPEAPELLVTIALAPREGGGTVVTLTHGTYRETPEDSEEREGHVQGWQYAFARLRALR